MCIGTGQDSLEVKPCSCQLAAIDGVGAALSNFLLGSSGHIAGGINPPGGKRVRPYWTNPSRAVDPDEWFEGAEKVEESWWVEWTRWLDGRSGKNVAAREPGSGEYPPLADAPGTYVLEK